LASSRAQTPIELARFGTGAFTVGGGDVTTAVATQSAAGLTFSSVALGDTLGGVFPSAQNWARSDYGTFGVIMSIEGANPGLPFHVELYDSAFKLVAMLEGTTVGVGATAVFVPLQFSSSPVPNLGVVRGLQWTWDGGAAIKATVHSLAVLSSSPADVVAPVWGALPAKRYTKATEFVLRVSAQDDRGVVRMNCRITKPDGTVLNLARNFGGGQISAAWSPKLQLDQEGLWRIQLLARDAAGNVSRRNTTIVADRSKPSVKVTSPSRAPQTTYRLEATLSDTRSFPNQVRFRLLPPGGAFSNWSNWQRLSGTKLTKEWWRDLDLRKLGPWQVEIQVRDKAGNLGFRAFSVTR